MIGYIAFRKGKPLPEGTNLDEAYIFNTEDDALDFFKVYKDVTAKKVTRVTSIDENIDDVTKAMDLAPYDWCGLVRFFEDNRRDKRNKKIAGYTDVGRLRKAKELKEFSENCWSYAVDAVLFALDNHYQGFSDGGQLYFKGDLDLYKAKDALKKI